MLYGHQLHFSSLLEGHPRSSCSGKEALTSNLIMSQKETQSEGIWRAWCYRASFHPCPKHCKLSRKQIVRYFVDFQCPLSTSNYAHMQYISSSDHSIAVIADTGVLVRGSFVMGIVTLLVVLSFVELKLPGQYVSV